MLETIRKCDKCRQKFDIQSISIDLGSYIDASGSKDHHYLEFELCVRCMGELAVQLLSDFNILLKWLDGNKVNYNRG
jgi:hypothetical protein